MRPKIDFERVRKALFCQEPDRVPLLELGIDQLIKKAFLGKPVNDLKTEIEFRVAAGCDFVHIGAGGNFPGRWRGVDNKEYSSYTHWGGALEERKWVVEDGGTIVDMEDFENYPWPELKDIDYSHFEEVSEYLPEGMKIIGSAGEIFDRVRMLMGFERFAIATVENPVLVQRMFEKIGEITFGIFKDITEFDNLGAMLHDDDLGYGEGLMVSPAVLRKYLFPWYEKMGQICKKRNIPFIVHSDGDIQQVLNDFIEAGVNAIHPVEPKAMDIVELKRKWGDRLCLIGNINVDTLARGTSQEVEGEVVQRIRNIAPGGGYCVSSSNSIANYVRLENYKKMIEATFKYGRYPIRI